MHEQNRMLKFFRVFMILSGLCSVFVRAFTLFSFRSFMLLTVCHFFLPVSSLCASLFPPCAFLCLFVYAMCPLCCCPCFHPSPVPNHHPVCLSDWFLLCPVNSPCLVHLCYCLPRLDCSHLSLIICCLCVYIVLVFLSLVARSEER